jgi:hypothetical protein
VFSASVRDLWRFRYVRPDAATRLESRGWTFRRRFWRAWSTPLRLPRMVATFGWSGPRATPPLASVRSSCSPAPSRHGWRSGRTLPSRGPDIDSDTCPDRRPNGHPGLACWTVGVQPSRSGVPIPTAMVRVMAKRLARQSPSRPASVQPGRMTLFAQVLRSLNSGPDQGKRSPWPHGALIRLDR